MSANKSQVYLTDGQDGRGVRDVEGAVPYEGAGR